MPGRDGHQRSTRGLGQSLTGANRSVRVAGDTPRTHEDEAQCIHLGVNARSS